MKKNKPPKGFKKLSKLDKEYIKETEKRNRLALKLIPKGSAEDGSDFLKLISEMLKDPSRYDNMCKKINDDVEKEFK